MRGFAEFLQMFHWWLFWLGAALFVLGLCLRRARRTVSQKIQVSAKGTVCGPITNINRIDVSSPQVPQAPYRWLTLVANACTIFGFLLTLLQAVLGFFLGLSPGVVR